MSGKNVNGTRKDRLTMGRIYGKPGFQGNRVLGRGFCVVFAWNPFAGACGNYGAVLKYGHMEILRLYQVIEESGT